MSKIAAFFPIVFMFIFALEIIPVHSNQTENIDKCSKLPDFNNLHYCNEVTDISNSIRINVMVDEYRKMLFDRNIDKTTISNFIDEQFPIGGNLFEFNIMAQYELSLFRGDPYETSVHALAVLYKTQGKPMFLRNTNDELKAIISSQLSANPYELIAADLCNRYKIFCSEQAYGFREYEQTLNFQRHIKTFRDWLSNIKNYRKVMGKKLNYHNFDFTLYGERILVSPKKSNK